LQNTINYLYPLLKIILREIESILEPQTIRGLSRKLRNIEKPEEILATIWGIDYYIPLYYRRYKWWYTLIYEKLITNKERELRNIFNYIKEKVPREAYKGLLKPDIMSKNSTYINTRSQLTKWREYLKECQIKNILKITHWFELNFYTEDPEPDYKELKNWLHHLF